MVEPRNGNSGAVADTPALGRFLREHEAAIVERWLLEIGDLSKAQRVSTPALIDHIPSLLAEIAARADQMRRGEPEALPTRNAVAHAVQRLDIGFDLEEVAHEYRVLRRTILRRLDEERVTLSGNELRFLHEAVDLAMGRAISGYAQAEQRVLRAIDRVSAAGFDATDLDQMLARLLTVFAELAAPVDTIMLLLRDGDRLRVRASTGFDQEMRDLSVPIDGTFSGAILRERRPAAIADAATDPLVTVERVRATGLKALYGAPLLDGDEVIGVAQMGSRSAAIFSQEQEVLFRAMAGRATSMISRALSVARDRAASIAAHALAASGTLDEAGARLLAGIGEAFHWDVGFYWRSEDGLLRCREGWTAAGTDLSAFHDLTRRTEFARGAGLPGRAWQSGAVEWIANVASEESLPRRMAAVRSGLHSAIAFPLSTGDTIPGVLEFFSRVPRAAGEEAVEMTSAIARQLPEFVRRLETQDKLRQSEAQKSAMLDVALDCIVSMDGDGLVVGWNPAAVRTFGYAAGEAVGRELAELIIPPELRGQHRAGLTRYLATGEHQYLNRRLEVPAVRRDQSRIVVELVITRVPVDGPALFTGYLRDITDQKQAAEAQARLHREAEEAGRMRERLLAIVAHDLRNPLAAALTGATLLLKSGAAAADAALSRRADTIVRACSRMDRF